MIKTLLKLFFLFLYCTSYGKAVEQPFCEEEKIFTQGTALIEPLKVKERTGIVKSYLEDNPQLTMITKVKGLYEKVYLRDFNFILQEIKKHPNPEDIISKLIEFDQNIVQTFYKQEMSFADLNFIALVWAATISDSLYSCEIINGNAVTTKYDANLIYTLYQKALVIYQENEFIDKYADLDQRLGDFFIQTSGLIIPHISPTGLIPIPIINEGYGFWVKDGQASSIDYVAIGTNKELSYDGVEGQDAHLLWAHDRNHIGDASRYGEDFQGEKYQARVSEIARLRSDMIKKVVPNSLEWRCAEYVFYEIFHEEGFSGAIKELPQFLALKRENIENQQQNGLNEGDLNLFRSFRKSSAEYFKLPIEGKTLEDQMRSYNDNLLVGINLLSSFASNHNN